MTAIRVVYEVDVSEDWSEDEVFAAVRAKIDEPNELEEIGDDE